MDCRGNPSPSLQDVVANVNHRRTLLQQMGARGEDGANQWAFRLTMTSLQLNQSVSTEERLAYRSMHFHFLLYLLRSCAEECSTKSFGHWYVVFVCIHVCTYTDIQYIYVQIQVMAKKNGNTNVKSLNRSLRYHVWPVWPVCTEASSPPSSGILQEGCGNILP